MSFTYDQLKQAIQDYTENTETTFVGNLPLFIRASEERILKNVQLDLFRRNQTANLTAANPYLNCPSDFLAPFSLSYILVGPTPDVNYVVELHYLYRPASLTAGAGSGTTWLSQNGELSLLYGALVEAYIFMKGEPDVMQQYNQRFNESMIGLKMLGEAKETTQEYRVGKVVRPKQ